MAKISLRKKHTKPESEVKTMVEELARSLAQRYDAKTRWDGDNAVTISHPRLNGRLQIHRDEVTIDVKLGMLAGAFKGKIESELRKALDEKLS
ncbi:polyhydroxyalkanoic acid system family protein [Litorivivens sp.]|uniref:polyhydroxyalkanoic acid system family protein n=1 Tax=Litorivivens sp. TaxID=2020868 RepID=UPI00356470ED